MTAILFLGNITNRAQSVTPVTKLPHEQERRIVFDARHNISEKDATIECRVRSARLVRCWSGTADI
jgi:hypothetical protein